MSAIKQKSSPVLRFVSNRDAGFRELLRQVIRESQVLRFAVAYVKTSGVKLFEKDLKRSVESGTKLRLVTCEDFSLTEGEALQRLHDLGADMRLYVTPYQSNFHPKVYIGETSGTFSCIVGSANLSDGAFRSNVEAGVYFEGGRTEPAVAGTTGFFYDLWDNDDSMVLDSPLLMQYRKVERRIRQQPPPMGALATRAAEEAPEYGQRRKEALQRGRKVVEMCRLAMEVGEKLHYDEVTARVRKLFPEWKHGRWPEASIRRDLMKFSTKHMSVDEAIFHWDEKEKGLYTRLR